MARREPSGVGRVFKGHGSIESRTIFLTHRAARAAPLLWWVAWYWGRIRDSCRGEVTEHLIAAAAAFYAMSLRHVLAHVMCDVRSLYAFGGRPFE